METRPARIVDQQICIGCLIKKESGDGVCRNYQLYVLGKKWMEIGSTGEYVPEGAIMRETRDVSRQLTIDLCRAVADAVPFVAGVSAVDLRILDVVR